MTDDMKVIDESVDEFSFALTDALAAAMAEFPTIEKTKTAEVKNKEGRFLYSFSYADLGDILDAVRPALSTHGVSLYWTTVTMNGELNVTCNIEKDGQTRSACLSWSTGGLKVQEVGSLLTYLKRYTLCCVVPVVGDEDDDGNAAAGNQATVSSRKASPKKGTTRKASPQKPKREDRPPPDDDVAGVLDGQKERNKLSVHHETGEEVVNGNGLTYEQWNSKEDDERKEHGDVTRKQLVFLTNLLKKKERDMGEFLELVREDQKVSWLWQLTKDGCRSLIDQVSALG